MAFPVTPLSLFTEVFPQDVQFREEHLETFVEPEGWAGLPGDLLYRISSLLDRQYDVPSLLATCRSWHCSLKAALTSLRLQYFGDRALGIGFSSVRVIDAARLRRTSFGFPYLVPIWHYQKLALGFPSLTSLNISGQDLGSNGLHTLEPLAYRLQHLDCSGCELACVDVSALASLVNLTSLVLNGVRASPKTHMPANPASLLAFFFTTKALRQLRHLRHLELSREEQVATGSAAGLSAAAAGQLQPHAQGYGAGEPAAAAPLPPAAPPGAPLRVELVGIPMLKMVSELTVLKHLSCLLLNSQELDATDFEALASLTSLTRLAFSLEATNPPLRLSVASWNALIDGPTGHNLRVLDVDLAGSDVLERLSLAPLTQLRVLRLRRCHSIDLLLSLMGRQTPPVLPATAFTGGASAAVATSASRRSSGVGVGASGAGGRQQRSAGWSSGGRDAGSGVGGGNLVRLELLEAGENITPALVAQVCSRLPSLRVLDVSRCFRFRPRFQLGGDLLVRDLAVLCPLLSRIVLDTVQLHGVGFPDGRDLALLPFVCSETVAERSGRAASPGHPRVAGLSGCAAPTSAAAAPANSPSSSDLVQLPFPRLTSLVVQGGPSFMKSRFRSFANLTALQQLRIEGMTEKDFLATCKMGCYEALSHLGSLTALQILASMKHHALGHQAAAQAAGAGGPLGAPPGAPADGAPPHPLANAGAGAVAGGAMGMGMGSAGGAGPSGSGRLRPEPHLNFITQLGALRILALEALTTRGRVFSYLAQLPHLRALSLAGSIDLSADGLESLRSSCMPGLRSLRMLGCIWDGVEQGVDAWSLLSCLPDTTPSLEELELGACTGITARRLAGLLVNLPPQSPQSQQQLHSGSSGPRLSPIFFALIGQSPPPRPRFQPTGLKRLRYIRLYDSLVSPDTALEEESALLCSNLHFLDFVDTSPGGLSFVLARHPDCFEVVAVPTGPAAKAAGRHDWRQHGVGYSKEAALEEEDGGDDDMTGHEEFLHLEG
ncbi:hypothetical protein VaNZ11_016916 [Volvox africanus]|uniref:F-box domain-containing protein n=1 Tax=Volvox africanus TaxID=51714 RepID=A0ABQ5SNQ7_9CHLO|nr:hypothetical protein VaNZ11_016916 [Volvox africanus]